MSVTPAAVGSRGSRGPGGKGADRHYSAALRAVLVLGAVVFGFLAFVSTRWWLAPANVVRSQADASAVASASVAPAPPAASDAQPEGMVYIPGGSFRMGRDDGDPLESPAHEVSVGPFYLDAYEVTCKQFRDFVEATGRKTPPGWGVRHCAEADDDLPITGVNWEDADAYAAWVGKRLPTEAEWEFAARGPQSLTFPWGAEWKSGAANAGTDGKGRAVAVGSHPSGASPFGVQDMIGNAWEWTASRFTPYANGGAPPPNAHEGEREMVLRGGCFLNSNAITAAFRRGWPAVGADYEQTGFRCAKDATR